MNTLKALISFCVIVTTCETYKILAVFPTPMHSHYTLTSKLANELARQGHEVTFVTPFPKNNTVKNFEEISVESVVAAINEEKKHLFETEDQGLLDHVVFLNNMGFIITEKTLQNENLQQLLHSSRKYDLVLLPEFLTPGLLGIGHHFKCPVILFSTMPLFSWSNYRLADARLPSYVPNILVGYAGQMNFWQRFINTINDFLSVTYYQFKVLPKHQEIVRKYIPGSPDLYQFLNNESLLLINSHMSSFQALPQMPNVIEIGGFHIDEAKPLPDDLQLFLDNSKEGVVLFSMGSNLKSSDLPDDKRKAILSAFAKLKENVLWKWEAEELPGKPPNVKVMTWLPQRDVLAHPNVKAFITHGGLLSTIESIYEAVPLIGIPIFADQKMNVELAKAHGYAVVVPFQQLNEELLLFALNQVLHDVKIKDNARTRSRIMRDQPLKPLDNAIYWIEYVGRYRGAPHLRYSGADLHWYQRYLLDILAFLIVLLLLGVFACNFLFKKGSKLVCNLSRKSKKD